MVKELQTVVSNRSGDEGCLTHQSVVGGRSRLIGLPMKSLRSKSEARECQINESYFVFESKRHGFRAGFLLTQHSG